MGALLRDYDIHFKNWRGGRPRNETKVNIPSFPGLSHGLGMRLVYKLYVYAHSF